MRPSILFWQLALAYVATVAVAVSQARLEIVPSAIPGVSLSGPSAGDFLKLVSGILPDEDALAALKPALPNILILRNSTQRAIVYYALRFDGKLITTDFDDPALGGKTHSFKADSYRLVSAIPGVEEVSDGLASPSRNPIVYKAFLAGAADLANAHTRVSVDSVVFDDGQFSGPDVSGIFDRLKLMTRARQRFVAEVKALDHSSDTDLKAALDAVMAEKGTDAGTAKRKEMALAMSAILRRRGRMALRINLQNIVDYPEIWR